MISYTKCKEGFLITLTFDGNVSKEVLIAVLNNAHNYVGTSDIPALYIIDCRGICSELGEEEQRQIVMAIVERHTKSFSKYAFLFAPRQIPTLNKRLLDLVNSRTDTRGHGFVSFEKAIDWLTSIPNVDIAMSTRRSEIQMPQANVYRFIRYPKANLYCPDSVESARGAEEGWYYSCIHQTRSAV